ncbi:hypothetical protein [Faecalimicrobium sp. JNUCC 81]
MRQNILKLLMHLKVYAIFYSTVNGLNEGIRTDFNQVGIETEPIKHADGKYYGFQSKNLDDNSRMFKK